MPAAWPGLACSDFQESERPPHIFVLLDRSRGSDAGRALVVGGDAESIGLGFSGWQVEAKRARRGCLTTPSTLPDGDLIGVRLSRDVLGHQPRPGRCLLHTGDGQLISVTVPAA